MFGKFECYKQRKKRCAVNMSLFTQLDMELVNKRRTYLLRGTRKKKKATASRAKSPCGKATATISKRPYRMDVKDLSELKKQIRGLLKKHLSVLACHLWEHQLFLLIKRLAVEECVWVIGHLMM